ncbi:MAG: hypothetical protein JWL80_678 [Parcubacteria group bacterium]|nr:hypothetical protein [Parcubacteria group bacterium]
MAAKKGPGFDAWKKRCQGARRGWKTRRRNERN